METPRTVAVDHAAHAFLEVLADLRVRHFFGNLGSDAPSIIDAFARFEAEGRNLPRPVQVSHEMCAVSMAHGFYLASGEISVVSVHSSVGTANALTGLINASRARVPMVVTAGQTAAREAGIPAARVIEPHWAQEAADQRSLVRQYVKWDYELRDVAELESVVRRAFAIALSEPRGPVYLTLPMDVMARPHEPLVLSGRPLTVATAPHPDPEVVEEVADLLAAARAPLIITRSYGRRPQAVPALVELAELGGLPVVEYQIAEAMNFPSSHDLHLGYDPTPYLQQADVILVIDCPVPWVPSFVTPRPEATVVHLGVDPLWSDLPRWGFTATHALTGDSWAGVRRLVEALRRKRSGYRRRIEKRAKATAAQHRRQRQEWEGQARAAGEAELSSPEWVSHCLRPHLDANTLVVQEYDLKLKHTAFDRPGSYFGFSPAGGLGFGVGGALGVKLAATDKTVISVVGDGTYLLGVPSAAHLASAAYELPILWVVINNHGWGAVKLQNQIVHPEGWAARSGNFPLIRFGYNAAYEHFSRACGGGGEMVRSARQLPDALDRALTVVRRERRQVLLNIDCGEPAFSL